LIYALKKIFNMNDTDILQKIKKYDFYHRIKLTENITTPGINRKQIQKNIDQIRKLDLKNKKVLDIGCRDGIYSFEAEKMGASQVIAIDNDISKPATEFLIPFFKSKVQMQEMNLFDLNEKSFGKFDVIIFPGTLYHLRYPFQALKIISDILKEDGILILETAILQESFDRAILYCPINEDGPFGSTSCTFFNPKGLIDTLISMGIETKDYSLSFKVNKYKIFLKSILRIFFKKKFLGKNLTTVCRGLFLCKKNSKLIDQNDSKYWDLVHERHTLHQKDSSSYKDYFKS
jgi:SAM-dependent methyltransferase